MSDYIQVLLSARSVFDEEIELSKYNRLESIGLIRDSSEIAIDDNQNRYCKIGIFEHGFSVASEEYSK